MKDMLQRRYVYIGQQLATTQPDPEERFDLAGLKKALHQATPTLIAGAIITGAAFAIGSGLVSRYLFPPRGR